MRILVILDPLERLHLAGDTSYALMREAARRGHEVWTCQLDHLGLEHDEAVADAQLTEIRLDDASPVGGAASPFVLAARATMRLGDFDVVMMRKDPPFDVAYLQATWILERARGKTVLMNDPRGLRELNEHLAILAFPDLTVPTIVTRSQARLRAFLDEQGGAIVVKPVDGYAGLGVFLVRRGDPNASSIFETATQAGRAWTMGQAYLPAAVDGDKRIVLVDGEPIGAVLRVPPPAEARGNLHIGGRPVRTDVDDADRAIIARVAPLLREHGQIFVGIDVIGGRLTEINITSPTGIRHIEELERRNVSAPVIDCLEEKARQLRAARS